MNPIWQQDIDEDIALKKKTQDAIAAAVASERESIVKMIEDLSNDFDPYSATAQGACDTISDAIRARGNES